MLLDYFLDFFTPGKDFYYPLAFILDLQIIAIFKSALKNFPELSLSFLPWNLEQVKVPCQETDI